jgi:hypothetical protein
MLLEFQRDRVDASLETRRAGEYLVEFKQGP